MRKAATSRPTPKTASSPHRVLPAPGMPVTNSDGLAAGSAGSRGWLRRSPSGWRPEPRGRPAPPPDPRRRCARRGCARPPRCRAPAGRAHRPRPATSSGAAGTGDAAQRPRSSAPRPGASLASGGVPRQHQWRRHRRHRGPGRDQDRNDREAARAGVKILQVERVILHLAQIRSSTRDAPALISSTKTPRGVASTASSRLPRRRRRNSRCSAQPRPPPSPKAPRAAGRPSHARRAAAAAR